MVSLNTQQDELGENMILKIKWDFLCQEGKRQYSRKEKNTQRRKPWKIKTKKKTNIKMPGCTLTSTTGLKSVLNNKVVFLRN